MTMAGITRRLAKVCCGSSAALSDTQDIEADRPDSSQCHGEDQQESADQRYVLEAELEVLYRGKQQPCGLDQPCALDTCVPGVAGCLTSMVALNNLLPLQICSQLMCLLSGFVTCFRLMTVWCCQPQPRPLTQIVNRSEQRTSLHLLPPAGSRLQAHPTVVYFSEACDWSVNP